MASARICYAPAVRTLRLDGETDQEFRSRAEQAASIAQALVAGCLANHQIKQMILEGQLTEDIVRRSPTVRVEFEQAIAIGGIGESLDATKSKHWGDGPWIMPLEPDDIFFPQRITYLYRVNSLYNRRFEQRARLKELLGKNRKIVGDAKYFTKAIFLRQLTSEQATAIRRCLNIEPGDFWRAAQGTIFLDLPKRHVQLDLPFE